MSTATPERAPRRRKRGPLGFVAAVIRVFLRVVGELLLLAYLLVSRTILVFGALYLTLYFLAGARPLKAMIEQVIADRMPGAITAASVQWGPLPWELRVAGGRISDKDGREVIRVRGVDARIDLGTTLSGLADFIFGAGDAPLRVRFEDVELLEPAASVRVADDGDVNIASAFYIPGWHPHGWVPGQPEHPLYLDITARTVRLLDAAGQVDGPGIRAEGRGVDTVTDFSLTGEDHVEFRAERVRMPEATVHLDFVPGVPGSVAIPVRDLVVDGYHWNHVGFEWAKARGSFGDPARPSGTFEGTSGALDADPALVTWRGRAKVHARDGAPETGLLTGDLVSGPVDLELDGKGDIEQVAVTWLLESEHLGIAPLAFDDVTARGRILPGGADPTGRYHAVTVDDAVGRIAGGSVHVHDLALDAPPQGPDRAFASRDLALAFETREVALDGILPTLFPAMPLAIAPLLDGRWSCRGGLARQHRAGLPSTLDLTLDEARLAWRPGIPLLAGDWALSGALRMDGDRLALERVVVDQGENRVRLAGSLDLRSGELDLEPYARVGDLAPLARAAGISAGGRFVVKEARATGTALAPRLAATLNWTEALLEGRRLDQVTGRLELRDGVLRVIDLRSKNEVAQLALDGELRLLDGAGGLDPRLPFAISRVHLERVAIGALVGGLGPNARLALDGQHVSGSIVAPLEDLRGRAKVALDNLVLGGEPIAAIETDAEMGPDRLALRALRVRLPSHPPGPAGSTAPADWSATGEIDLGLRSRSLRGHVAVPPLALHDLEALARAAPELGGTVDLRLDLGGTLARPTFIGTLGARGITWGEVVLGDARLNVLTRPDGKVDLSALDQDFWRGVTLDDAVLTLDGLAPRRLELGAHVTDLALADLVPSAKDAPVAVVASARARLDVGLAPGLPTSFELESARDEIRVTLRDRGQVWTNSTPLALRRTTEDLTLERVSLGPRSGAPGLEACGTIGRALDLHLAGQLELAFVPSLTDVFSVTDGRLLLGGPATAGPPAPLPNAGHRRPADEVGAARVDCLAGAPAVAIRGTPTAPAITGRLAAQGVVLVPRGSGREIRLADGSTLRLAPDADGRQVIELPTDAPLRGELDDGTFALTGRVALEDFVPDSVELDLVGADLFFQRPGEFAVTASPRGHISIRGLAGPSPSARVSGAVAISEGRFSKSFDTLAQAIGGAVGGRADAYSSSLTETLPWLADTRLDIDVTAAEFQIQTALPLVRTDLPARLDLSLGGTFDKPQLFRRVDLMAGGTLTYLVFERAFHVSSGAIDFDGDPERPLVDVTAQSMITYLARASTSSLEEDEKEVTITLHMVGRVPDLKIELSSDDATFDQADIQSLILTGKPRGDLDRAQESRVFSADLANVLNTVFKAPFVKTASVGFGQQGALEYRVGTCFAPNLCFDTTTVAADTETTLKAKFSLMIGDNLVCEGTLRRSDASTTSLQETYEARCRYRIPLE